jgi:hypothetical protein
MRRVIGLDVHRTFAEVVFWEDGRLRPAGRVDMTRSGLEGFGRTLANTDEVVVEATGNAMAVVRMDQHGTSGPPLMSALSSARRASPSGARGWCQSDARGGRRSGTDDG